MPIAVKDLDGKVCFHIDGEFARDDAGSVIGQPGRQSIGAEQKLSFLASRWMSGRSAPSFSTKDEKPVLLDLAPTDLSTPSAQASFGLEDGECIADKVSPIRPTKHLQGIWYAENVGDATQLVTAEANLDGAPNLLSPSFTPTTFTTIGYALAVKLPVELIANADFDLKRRATRFLVEKLRLAREKRVAALLTTTANWAAGNRVAIPAKWNGGTTANPMADMFSALAVSALPANVIVLPEQIAQYFYQNANSTALRDYVQSGGDMPKVIFARARYSVAGAYQYVWAPAAPANVPLLRVPEDPDSIPSCVTFRWMPEGSAALADGRRFEGVLVREFFDKSSPGRGDYWIVVAHNDVEVQISNQVGAVIVGALQ